MHIYSRLFAFSRYQRSLLAVTFIVIFLVAMMGVMAIGYLNIRSELRGQIFTEIGNFDQLEQNLDATFSVLEANRTLEPCSPEFLSWLRRIAFFPDGVHELIYAENDRILCSVTGGVMETPILLGPPDIADADSRTRIWLDRDLGLIGFPGLTGSFQQRGNYILVVPTPETMFAPPEWIGYQLVAIGENGKWWHRDGKKDAYQRYLDGGAQTFSLKHRAFFNVVCDTSQTLCLVTDTPLTSALAGRLPILALALVLALMVAGVLTFALKRRLEVFWSFSSRLRHQLAADAVMCLYQPILSLRTNTISGVEVLARWRDVDGTMVFPDRFLPVIEEHGLTRPFTEAVVQRAFADLSALPCGPARMRVNFNIFPRDFEAGWLELVLHEFLAVPERFEVVVELVETEEIGVAATREVIAQLRNLGIKTFIDDFGVGYSSINYLAGLAADGVKIDRSFAMAPTDSLMDNMLTSAIEMIHKTGQEMVVEGIETAGRLAELRDNHMVDHIQGYHFCRPLELKALAAFMTGYNDAAPAVPARHIAALI